MPQITGRVYDIGLSGSKGKMWLSAGFRTGTDGVVAPRRVSYPIVDGELPDNVIVEPGPAYLEIDVGMDAHNGWPVNIPETDVSLKDLISEVYDWSPTELSLFAQMRIAAEGAAQEAATLAGEAGTAKGAAEDAAAAAALDRVHVDSIRALLDEAAENNVAPYLTPSALNATYAQGSMTSARAETVQIDTATILPMDVIDGWLYAAEGTLLRRSNDRGLTYETVKDLGAGGAIIGIRKLATGEVIVIRHTGGLWRSSGWATDPTTATFTQILAPTPSAYFLQWGVDVSGTHLVVTEYNATDFTTSRKVFYSSNNGDTWTDIFDSNTDPRMTDGPGTHMHFAAFDPWDGNRIYMSFHNMSATVRQRGVWSVPLAALDGLTTPWEVVTDQWQPTTMTPTDKGIVFSSDQPNGGVFVISRSDPLRRYRRGWSWRSTGPQLPGFGYKGVRDPATGVVYAAWVAYPGAKPIITASDGVTGSLVWEADTAAVGAVNGVRDINVVDGWLIGTLRDSDAPTWSVLRTPIPPLVPRVPTDDDPGRMLGGRADATTTAQNTAVGLDAVAQAYAEGSTALGVSAFAGGAGSTAIGWKSRVPANGSTAIGDQAEVTDAAFSGSVAIGYQSKANGASATVIGRVATGGTNTTAVGRNATAGTNGVVVGEGAVIEASKSASVSIGRLANCNAARAVVVGSEASTTNDHSVVVGSQATSTGGYGTALGRSASVGHSYAVALGANSASTLSYQVAVGQRHFEANTLTASPGAAATGAARFYFLNDATTGAAMYVRTSTGTYKVTMS